MLQSSALIQAAEEGAHIVNELPMEAHWFGIIAFLTFIGLFVITWTFSPRSTLPEATGHHADPAALPADEAHAVAQYESKRSR
ncbi:MULTISPECIES: hypothetical protein [Kocuria]|uniref:Uncharacterized protein n=1 Tax=Kocuria subflava TaxID=1736139 RepID=A0A846U7K4_9MICC|nr:MULTISPECIES: hypothetical protein [Kocuria]NKE09586.1 hypothetical protein [Kocuria subflava]